VDVVAGDRRLGNAEQQLRDRIAVAECALAFDGAAVERDRLGVRAPVAKERGSQTREIAVDVGIGDGRRSSLGPLEILLRAA
jgi:hypothetical protein